MIELEGTVARLSAISATEESFERGTADAKLTVSHSLQRNGRRRSEAIGVLVETFRSDERAHTPMGNKIFNYLEQLALGGR